MVYRKPRHLTLKGRHGLRTKLQHADGSYEYMVYQDSGVKDMNTGGCGSLRCLHYGSETFVWVGEVELTTEEAAMLLLQGKICGG